ncbi:MAG: hypothetical protein ACJ0QT_00670 [Gammaproteobacteria bacterium]|tara:strand:- start:183 stop:983 length:801 start_codon:yes stop_codon:yes gene_type:complete
MKIRNLIFLMLVFSGCAKSLIPLPMIAVPEVNVNPDPTASYGAYPENYQKILQDFLKTKYKDSSKVQIEFVSKPEKLAVSTMTDNVYGYRVCLSIFDESSVKSKRGYKNHFFLINNGKIRLYLFDSGLLKIPFELCVSRTSTNYKYLDDIKEIPDPTSIDKMDDPNIVKPRGKIEEYQKPKSNTFILCIIEENEYTYVFNESNNIFFESIGIDQFHYENVEFSDTHILATSGPKELLINRVSGTMYITNEEIKEKGVCKLSDKTEF